MFKCALTVLGSGDLQINSFRAVRDETIASKIKPLTAEILVIMCEHKINKRQKKFNVKPVLI